MKSATSALAARLKRSLPWAIAFVALLSLGTAAATKLVTGREIANHTITGKDVKKRSLPLSVLTTKPRGTPGLAGAKGAPGAKGATGEKGQAGEIGPIGPEGEVGPSAITELASLNSPVAAEIAPDAQFAFVGAAAEILITDGDVGQVNGTVTIGSSEGIDDRVAFELTVCAKVGNGPVTPIETEEEETTGKVGISPALPKGVRTAVPFSSGFAVSGGEGFSEAEVGPCLITPKKLDENDRVVGEVTVAES